MSSAMSQMRRVDELEAHYAVKKRELETIQREIGERQAQLELNSARGEKSDDGSGAGAAADSKPTSPKGPVPAVGRCAVVMSALASREYLETLPLYEAHNATSALRAAVECEQQLVLSLKRDLSTLTTEYEQTSARASRALKALQEFKRETGYVDPSAKGIVKQKSPPSVNGSKKNDASSPASAAPAASQSPSSESAPASSRRPMSGRSAKAAAPETAAQRGEREKKELADQYILQMRKVEEHLKASRLLQKKLEASLKELDKAGSVQHETEMKVDEARNAALVVDRDVRLKQAELLELREMQSQCDGEMARIEKRREDEQELLDTITAQFRKVKGEAADVGEQRRQWEETIKAQDRRLAELRERKDMIDQAIENHGMKADVQRYVEAATAQRQAAKEGPQPSEDLTDIISHYADVNMLAPAEEAVPQGVVVLLSSLHDKLAHRVRCKEVLAEEKASAADALREHVQEMVGEHDSSEDRLYAAKVDCEREVVENVDAAKNALVDLRDEYSAVKSVSLSMQRQQRQASTKRTSEPLPEMQFKDKKQK